MLSSFKVQFPQSSLDDLSMRLKNTRWPDEIRDSGWEYGAAMDYMKTLVDYWKNEFNWRATEREINAFPNLKFETDGYSVHFIHIKSKNQHAIPLIITHGWPGSFMEMFKMIPLLQNDFSLVIPSIPGFGLSPGVTEKGCNLWAIGDIWNKLMNELGYDRYMLQGGDFGAGVNTAIALKHPENVIGMHLNYIPGSYYPYLSEEDSFTEEEKKFLQYAQEWFKNEGAYAHLHRTKPLTAAYGLNDSPVGLCAWILEKFMTWSDCKGDVESVFTKDELLSDITLYWLTGTIHSSIRLYNENSKAPLQFKKDDYISVPVGIAHFKEEAPFPPRKFIERGYNVVHLTDFDSGGHFAAMEKPNELAQDVKAFAERTLQLNSNQHS